MHVSSLAYCFPTTAELGNNKFGRLDRKVGTGRTSSLLEPEEMGSRQGRFHKFFLAVASRTPLLISVWFFFSQKKKEKNK